jgi:SAM-dependent methyltransferase
LEIACGYGRLTRFLVQEIPGERLRISDIYSRAVAFQRQQFFVNGFDSVTEPGALICEQRFDLIFVVSLFTHLPERRFEQWLAKLYSLLTPRGLLVFSVHGEHLAGGVPIPPSGLLFKPTSESGSLEVAENGVSYVTEAFVREMLGRARGVNGSYLRLLSALCRAQDVYLVSRNPQEDYSACRYRHDSLGYVDSVWHTAANEARAHGWAVDPNEGKHVIEIQVKLNGRRVGQCPVDRPRPDVAQAMKTTKYARAGWECLLSLGNVPSGGEAALEFWAISSDGASTLLDVRWPVPA